ncbi:hypothetical protein KMW28_24630 [Flammeovirga yaeyamensis]|uniref:Uncharacterized protein n=1 Tax=Flammeovirga yaeyamensis TaxID=367791 RepID=A0AAX1N975_9BACT|nr:hypothetical protein [Flammeovirga yaeyamensis]MBB3699526.1 hypothetical protein [Flammeovirga yaeyamensis]NMF35218.1 hypothetical protein [Flammeovirga yaeyamensis]QWG04080.1 hypothetical protein KMW28_24630 [Flammeovirga yaeyamensis]
MKNLLLICFILIYSNILLGQEKFQKGFHKQIENWKTYRLRIESTSVDSKVKELNLLESFTNIVLKQNTPLKKEVKEPELYTKHDTCIYCGYQK